jgi:hypothetical protein
LQNYQAILSLDTPLAAMTKAKRDKAWVKICEEIEKAVKESPESPLSPGAQLNMVRTPVSGATSVSPRRSRPASNRRDQDSVEPQDRLLYEVESLFRDFDYVCRKAYNVEFSEVLTESNRRRRSIRIRQVSGVILKLHYSEEKIIEHRSTGRKEYKWRIDTEKLTRKPDKDWEFKLLEAYPGRTSAETGKNVASRLKRETLLGLAFVQAIHRYVCKDAETRNRVRELLKQAGLEEFTGLATSEGALKAGIMWLIPRLTPVFNALPATGIAACTVVLAVRGLDAICESCSRVRHGN